MSGLTAAEAIAILDNEPSGIDVDVELDVQRYAEEEYDDDDELVMYSAEEINGNSLVEPVQDAVPIPQEIELPYLRHGRHEIRRNTVVELKDHSGRKSRHPVSGDFLLVRNIIESIQTEEVRLRGYRLRRCSYMQPLFDRKLNDLFMMIEIDEHDKRPRFIQSLIDVDPKEIVQIRHCIFTNLSWGAQNFKHINFSVPLGVTTQEQIQHYLFHKSAVVCRWLYVINLHPNAVSYGGELRRIYKREALDFSNTTSTQHLGAVQSTPLSSRALNGTQNALRKKFKGSKFTMADYFCCSGGTSAGAQQAGFEIKLGLDNDSVAMEAYRRNFPNAMHFEIDAADFLQIARRSDHGCDHVHMSCPCCFWSICHSVDGKNDDKNIAALYTVEEILKRLKPKTFSLEQAPGLLQLKKHRLQFRQMLNSIISQGYNVRYTVQDQAWFGLPQHRRRLVIVGAKIAIPIPPFPQPIHGPSGSGLKRFRTVQDALQPLERRSRSNDPYHQPAGMPRRNEPAIDPRVCLARTVTCNGGNNIHYSGKRSNTVRELSMFQGFSLDHHFAGPQTEAKRQCGNSWGPIASKHYFKVWAAHMEAFYHGFIDSEDEVLDLWDFLESKDIAIPRTRVIDLDAMACSAPVIDVDAFASGLSSHSPQFRYLTKIEKPVKPHFPLPLWARHQAVDLLPRRVAEHQTRDNSPQNSVQESGADRIFQEQLRRALQLSRLDQGRQETLEKMRRARFRGEVVDLT